MARTKQTARKSTGGKVPRKAVVHASYRGRGRGRGGGTVAARRAVPNSASYSSAHVRGRGRGRGSPGGWSGRGRGRGRGRGSGSYRSRSPSPEPENDEPVLVNYDVTYETSFYAHYFATRPTSAGEQKADEKALFKPLVAHAITLDPLDNENQEKWIGVSFASKYDGPGMERIGRPHLNLVLVLDVSSSMNWSFHTDGPGFSPQDKITVAKASILKLLTQLRPEDCFGLVIFNTAATVVHPLSKWSETNVPLLRNKVNSLRANGGTTITLGIEAANTMLDHLPEENDLSNWIWFLTDMEVSSHDGQTFTDLIKSNSQKAVFSMISGVGMDLKSDIFERISKTAGCNYSNIRSEESFEDFVKNEFSFSVTPIAFSVDIKVASEGHSFIKGMGTPELRQVKDGDTSCHLSTVFPQRQNDLGENRSGILLFRANNDDNKTVEVIVEWDDLNGVRHSDSTSIDFGEPLEANGDENKMVDEGDEANAPESLATIGRFNTTGVRKAILLVRFTDYITNYIEKRQAENSKKSLQVYEDLRKVFPKFVSHYVSEMVNLGDKSLQEEHGHLVDFADKDDMPLEKYTSEQQLVIDQWNGKASAPEVGKDSPSSPMSSSSSSSSGVASKPSAPDAQECCICLVNPKNMLLRPCRHVCICAECAPKVKKCPLCQKEITKRTKVYL